MVSGTSLYSLLLGPRELGDRLEAPDLSERAFARLVERPSFERAFFGGVEEAVHGPPGVGAGLLVGKLKSGGRRGERGEDAQDVERLVGPGYGQWERQRRAEDAAQREVFAALVGDVGGEVRVRAPVGGSLDAQLDGTGLEEGAVPGEIQGATDGSKRIPGIEEGAGLGLAPHLEALLAAQKLFEVGLYPVRRAFYLPDAPEARGAVEPPRQGEGLGGPLTVQVEDGAAHVLLGDAGGGGNLHENLGGDAPYTGGVAAAGAQHGRAPQDQLHLGRGQTVFDPLLSHAGPTRTSGPPRPRW